MILPSTGNYRVNAKINGVSLDDFSFVSSNDDIQPFFEVPVSDDPDVTGLMVFFKDARGETRGPRVLYIVDVEKAEELALENQNEQEDIAAEKNPLTLNNENEEDEENLNEEAEDEARDEDEELLEENQIKDGELIIIPVKSLDDILPSFPIPAGLPIGRYLLTFQVMGENTVLFKTESSFYYLADANFSFDAIHVHMPGIAPSSQIIPQGTVIMLEARLDFDSRLDPYIVWYNGRRIISEGIYSEGAGNLLWATPEQSGFFSLSAEAFPLVNRHGLVGYQKGISLLVSARDVNMNFLSEDISNLIQWYTFEGDVGDLAPQRQNQQPIWMPSNGTYGLATGPNNAYTLPDTLILDSENESWQIVFRFRPLSEGRIFSVLFESSNAAITLDNKEEDFILTLSSNASVFTDILALPEADSFITVMVNFTVQSGALYANFNIIEDINNLNDPVIYTMGLNAEIDNGFKIMLGSVQNNAAQNSNFTALWDEFALLGISVDIIEEELPEPPGAATPEITGDFIEETLLACDEDADSLG